MKRFLSITLSVLLCFVLVGCGGPKKVTDQQMTLNLTFGDRSGTYTGEVNDQGTPNGTGKFTTKNTNGKTWIYEGQFKNGHFEGTGKETWPDTGVTIEGPFSNDKLNGQGKRTVKNQPDKTYEGNFEASVEMVAESAELNETVTFADWEYQVTQVTEQTSARNMQASGRYVVVVLNDKNNGTEVRQPGAGDFFVLFNKKTGAVYRVDDKATLEVRMNTIFTGDSNSPWYLSQVNPGNSVQGIKLLFDIPKDIPISDLKLLPRSGFGTATPIQLQ